MSIPPSPPTPSEMQLSCLTFHLFGASKVSNRPCGSYSSCNEGREPGAAAEISGFGKFLERIITKL